MARPISGIYDLQLSDEISEAFRRFHERQFARPEINSIAGPSVPARAVSYELTVHITGPEGELLWFGTTLGGKEFSEPAKSPTPEQVERFAEGAFRGAVGVSSGSPLLRKLTE